MNASIDGVWPGGRRSLQRRRIYLQQRDIPLCHSGPPSDPAGSRDETAHSSLEDSMTRRQLLSALAALGLARPASAADAPRADAVRLSDDEWRKRLSAPQYNVLRHEATESPFSSSLNGEKRRGTYRCAGCDLALFTSEMKFDSGTGWPSFTTTLPEAVATRTDYKLIFPRTEYHCARCGGHQGHVFNDGPKPTGLRYCNNGVALKFEPQGA